MNEVHYSLGETGVNDLLLYGWGCLSPITIVFSGRYSTSKVKYEL